MTPLVRGSLGWVFVTCGLVVQGTVQNFAIDLAGALFFGFLVARDLKAKTKAEAVVEREDALGRLQVCSTSPPTRASTPALSLHTSTSPLHLSSGSSEARAG